MREKQIEERLRSSIPGGAHTYSRGRDQFSSNAPVILERGDGAYVWDSAANRYLDYGMGLRSVSLGYANFSVIERVRSVLSLGNNLTLPTMLELESAEFLIELIESVEMVKFAKHGSNVTTAAVKLARASTGRNLIAVTRQHPFHSFDDWFIGSTAMSLGVPIETQQQTLYFEYNDVASLEQLFDEHPDEVAAVILEPSTEETPCPQDCSAWAPQGPNCRQCPLHNHNFLMKVRHLCDDYGALMILDEIVTGFRWHMRGAQSQFGVVPDLTTFGKAMANGYALAALGGKSELMKLGGIDEPGAERVFLLSTTHGPEMVGLAAFQGTMHVYATEDVCGHIWNYGEQLRYEWLETTKRYGLAEYLTLEGPSASLVIVARDGEGQPSSFFRALVNQEMVKERVLIPWIAPSLSHGAEEIQLTARALERTCEVYRSALRQGVSHYLQGPPVKPVFRKYN